MTRPQKHGQHEDDMITFDTVDGLIVRPSTPDGYWLISKRERKMFTRIERAMLHELRQTHLTLSEECKSMRIEFLRMNDKLQKLNQAIIVGGAR